MGQSLPQRHIPISSAVSQPHEQLSVSIATTKKERERIYRFRYQIYVKEMGKLLSHVDHRRQLLYDDMDDGSYLLYARAGADVVGTVRLNIGDIDAFPRELVEVMEMDKFPGFRPQAGHIPPLAFSSKAMVDPNFRGSSLSSLLISSYYEICRQQGVLFNLAGCAPYLMAYYEHIGFRRYTRSFMVPDYGCMVPMIILTEDIDYLRQVRSPLLRVACNLENSPESVEWFAGQFPQMKNYINRQLTDKETFWQLLTAKLRQPPHKALSIFKGLSEAEAMTCAEVSHIHFCDQGDLLVQPTDMSNELFVVLSGRIAVRDYADRRRSMAVMHPGQSFGQKAFVTFSRQNIAAMANTDAELLIIPRQSLARLQTKHPEVAAKFARNIGLAPTRKSAYA